MFQSLKNLFGKSSTTLPPATQNISEALVIINLPSMEFMWLKEALAPFGFVPKASDEAALGSGPFYAFHWKGSCDEEKLHNILTEVFSTTNELSDMQDPKAGAMWTIQPLN